MKKKSTILVLITIFCFIATVALWFAVNKSNPEYTEVEAKVLSVDSRYVQGRRGTSRLEKEVIVEYQGKEYTLKNVISTSRFGVGRDATVYLSNGKLYENIDGVKTSTPLAMVYFAFLFITFGMIIISATYISRSRKKRKENM